MEHTRTYQEMLAAGWTPQRIRTAVAKGALTRVRSGSYVLGDPSPRAVLAAHLVACPRAVASHLTAAWLLGFADAPDELELTAPHDTTVRGLRGLSVHRTTRPIPTLELGGLRLTTGARTVVDLARRLPRDEAVVIGDAALHAGACDLLDLRREIDAARGRRHAAAAQCSLGACRAGAQSPMETRLRLRLIAAGLPEPVLQQAVRTATRTYHLDLAWPERRVGVDYDGVAYHSGSEAFARDRRRWRDMHAAGWSVWPVSAADVRDIRRLAAELMAALVMAA